MKITRSVVKDLLPLYAAGEVSPETRVLVEEFLREDPELAVLARTLGEQLLSPVPAPAGPSAGLAALERTRALLRRRSLLLALAIFFTGMPLSCVFDTGGFTFLMIRDSPAVGLASWVAAASLCAAYGLRPGRPA